jgi:hypothetical protein
MMDGKEWKETVFYFYDGMVTVARQIGDETVKVTFQ